MNLTGLVSPARCARLALMLASLVMLVMLSQPDASAQPASATSPPSAPQAIPAARQANNVAIITIHGKIDEWTDRSVRRRIQEAEKAGANAIVFDIDTPGGNMLAMLAISRTIKATSIKNTVAWVNRQAYSAGAVIAMACREIVVNDGAAMGDALPIMAMGPFAQAIPDAEREKILGPIITDLVESARRNGHDEVMVQGFVRRGVELWWVEHTQTGQRLFVTAEQYELATGKEPVRGTPSAPSITGPVDTSKTGPAGPAKPRDTSTAPLQSAGSTDVIPASPNMNPSLVQEVNDQLALKQSVTTRPDLRSPEHNGKYKQLEYVTSGSGVLTLAGDQMLKFGIATQAVRSDAELKTYFSASNLSRLDESWSEHLARFLDNMWVKGILVAVFLIALFIEMTHPGVILPGTVAVLALVALVLPPLLVSMHAWWMVAAILVGVGLIMLELLVLPGTILPGALGSVMLLGGLVGAVAGGPQNLFPGAGESSSGMFALLTVLISFVTAAGVIFMIARHLPSLPVFNRLVLKDTADDPNADLDAPPMPTYSDAGPVIKAGDTGEAVTPLRPSGRAQVGDDVIDVVTDGEMIDAGEKIRVISSSTFRIVVERA